MSPTFRNENSRTTFPKTTFLRARVSEPAESVLRSLRRPSGEQDRLRQNNHRECGVQSVPELGQPPTARRLQRLRQSKPRNPKPSSL